LLRRVTYPFKLNDENTLRDQTIFDNLRSLISKTSFTEEYIVGNNLEIPLDVIMPHLSNCCSSVDELELVYDELYNINECC